MRTAPAGKQKWRKRQQKQENICCASTNGHAAVLAVEGDQQKILWHGLTGSRAGGRGVVWIRVGVGHKYQPRFPRQTALCSPEVRHNTHGNASVKVSAIVVTENSMDHL